MLLIVARAGRPVGVRGEVAVEVRTDDPHLRFAEGAILGEFADDSLSRGTHIRDLTVRHARWHSGRLVLAFAEVADRDGAADLTGRYLAATVDVLAGDDPEEFHDRALAGLQARFKDGSPAGLVDSVVHLPAQDLLCIVDEAGRELLVPFVTSMVPEVDLPGGFVVIDPPEGLVGLADA